MATVGIIFNILGRVFISAANGTCVYIALTYIDDYKGKTESIIPACSVGFLEGAVIGTMFMTMFSFSSDTILMCFLVDEDEKKSGDARPAIMNQFI